jgi:hypothetical protein
MALPGVVALDPVLTGRYCPQPNFQPAATELGENEPLDLAGVR